MAASAIGAVAILLRASFDCILRVPTPLLTCTAPVCATQEPSIPLLALRSTPTTMERGLCLLPGPPMNPPQTLNPPQTPPRISPRKHDGFVEVLPPHNPHPTGVLNVT